MKVNIKNFNVAMEIKNKKAMALTRTLKLCICALALFVNASCAISDSPYSLRGDSESPRREYERRLPVCALGLSAASNWTHGWIPCLPSKAT